MASTSARSGDKKDIWPSQAAASLGGGQKASLSRSEEFLTRISTELTDEALFIARSHLNPMPNKEKQTKDQGTQISRHVFFTKTRGTDTRSDRNRTRTKAHLLPSPREKSVLECSSEQGKAPALKKWSTPQHPDNWRMSSVLPRTALSRPLALPPMSLSENLKAPLLQLAKPLILGGTPGHKQRHL